MELHEFKAVVDNAAALLASLRDIIPKHVSPELIAYLERLDSDPVGLELLRNVLPKKP